MLPRYLGRNKSGQKEMGFKELTPASADSSSESLPWCNEWALDNDDYEVPRLVHFIQRSATGYMVVTKEYKGMIKEGSKAFMDLREALEVWIRNEQKEFAVYATVKSNKKLALVLNDEELSHRWNKTERRYVQVMKVENAESEGKRLNPLLGGRGDVSRGADRREQASEEEGIKTASAASTKGKKG